MAADTSNGRCQFNAPAARVPTAPDDVRVAVARKTADDNVRVAELVKDGAPAEQVIHADGGQHGSFRNTALAYAGGNGVRLGVTYLAQAWKLAGGDICTALMKYRAGHHETRSSALSVRYCVAARAHLASVGYPVTGDVPEPTFGFRADAFRMGVAIGAQQAARRLARGIRLTSRVSWRRYDQRMEALDARGRAYRL